MPIFKLQYFDRNIFCHFVRECFKILTLAPGYILKIKSCGHLALAVCTPWSLVPLQQTVVGSNPKYFIVILRIGEK
jgi:hypothetical protein